MEARRIQLPKSLYISFVLCIALSVALSIFPVDSTVTLQILPKPGFPGQMCGSAYTSNGTLFAGDNNYRLYRSNDGGTTFTLVAQFPAQPNATSAIVGYVWMIFVDSRNYVFVSIPATNRLYRSINFGASFDQVLITNGTKNESCYIAMTEDNLGALYAATYSSIVNAQNPPLLKSTDGGSTWAVLRRFASIHIHNVKFNPANGYLYVATGEWTSGFSNQECERVFRSKDYGQTWSTVINRPSEVASQGATVYLAMLFRGNYVYLGSDQAYQYNWIDRFYDNGSNVNFTRQRVYSLPTDGYLPFMSSTILGDTILFSTSSEFFAGTQRIIASSDGENWGVIRQTAVTKTAHHTNILTINPSGVAFFSEGPGQTYIVTQPNPTPSPTPQETPIPTDNPLPVNTPDRTSNPTHQPQTRQQSNQATPKPTPTATPKPTATPNPPTDKPTPTNQTNQAPAPEVPNQTLPFAVGFTVCLITAVAVMAKKRLSNRRSQPFAGPQ